MPTQTIRPSTKTVKIAYVIVLLVVVGLAVGYAKFRPDDPPWVPALALLLFLIPIRMHIGRLFTRFILDAERLRLESGFFSKSTRTIEIHKVQDVRVDQSLGQRMLGVGDISIETAGGSSRLEMDNIDAPHRVAETILNAARPSSGGATQGTAI
jgi:uncharacterized membrane protein YdbT with pleckstrin-like domain